MTSDNETKTLNYLSDVLDTSEFHKGRLNVIDAPCGCGKTTAAINKIAPLASEPNKVLYLIDTVCGRERVSKEEGMVEATSSVMFDIQEDNFSDMVKKKVAQDGNLNDIDKDKVAQEGNLDDKDKKNVVVTTYAQFGSWCSQYYNNINNDPDKKFFPDLFDIIICDEVHNLVYFSEFDNHDNLKVCKDGNIAEDDTNYSKIARYSICQAVKRGNTLFVGMTATPEALNQLACPKRLIPIDKAGLVHYTERRVIHYVSLRGVLESLPKDRGCVGLYVSRITKMKEYEELARSLGFHPISIWSLHNAVHPMNDEQRDARDYLIDYEEVPPQYDLLIINASCETAINIRSHMSFFIVHHTNPTHQTQARGRYRGDLDTLYLLDKADGQLTVPDRFLDRPLFKDDKIELRKALGIKNDNGKYMPYNELFRLMEQSGYQVEEGNTGNGNFVMITQASPEESAEEPADESQPTD